MFLAYYIFLYAIIHSIVLMFAQCRLAAAKVKKPLSASPTKITSSNYSFIVLLHDQKYYKEKSIFIYLSGRHRRRPMQNHKEPLPLCVKKSQYCVNPAQYCDLSLQPHIFIFFLKMTTASMYIMTAYASTTAICVVMAA